MGARRAAGGHASRAAGESGREGRRRAWTASWFPCEAATCSGNVCTSPSTTGSFAGAPALMSFSAMSQRPAWARAGAEGVSHRTGGGRWGRFPAGLDRRRTSHATCRAWAKTAPGCSHNVQESQGRGNKAQANDQSACRARSMLLLAPVGRSGVYASHLHQRPASSQLQPSSPR